MAWATLYRIKKRRFLCFEFTKDFIIFKLCVNYPLQPEDKKELWSKKQSWENTYPGDELYYRISD